MSQSFDCQGLHYPDDLVFTAYVAVSSSASKSERASGELQVRLAVGLHWVRAVLQWGEWGEWGSQWLSRSKSPVLKAEAEVLLPLPTSCSVGPGRFQFPVKQASKKSYLGQTCSASLASDCHILVSNSCVTQQPSQYCGSVKNTLCLFLKYRLFNCSILVLKYPHGLISHM